MTRSETLATLRIIKQKGINQKNGKETQYMTKERWKVKPWQSQTLQNTDLRAEKEWNTNDKCRDTKNRKWIWEQGGPKKTEEGLFRKHEEGKRGGEESDLWN